MRKRIMAVVLAVVMVSSMIAMAIPTFAAESVKYELPAKDAINAALTDGNGVIELNGAKVTIKNVPDADREHQVGLKPRNGGEASVEFKFNVAKAGEYDLAVGLAATYAEGVVRKADMSVNGGAKTAIDVMSVIGDNTDWNKVFETPSCKVTLVAGENTVTFTSSEDYDGSTVKNINVSYITVAGEGLTAGETEAPETEAPEKPKVDPADPVAAYNFANKKLEDETGKQAAVVLDEEFEGREDPERLAGNSGRAEATDEGISLMNGFFKLPGNLFDKVAKEDITGLTVSITYKKNSDYGWGGTWSEHLFAFSDKWITNELKNEDDTMNYADRANSFFTTRNGNVATSKTPYSSEGNWMDGSLGEDYAKDAFATITVTVDLATNKASIYMDGKLLKTSDDYDWEVKATLTADDIKNFAYAAVGLPVGGDWGMWGFMTVKDLTVYTEALNADQVAVLAVDGWKALQKGAEVPNLPGDDNPKTGEDMSKFMPYFAVLAVSGMGVVVMATVVIADKRRYNR